MLDVLVLCEGHTEREFCKSVVAPYIASRGVAVQGTLAGRPQQKRGGVKNWSAYRKELIRLARQRTGRHVSLLIYYFRMPHSWPGRDDASKQPLSSRGRYVEEALIDDLPELGGLFHPCVQLHEFESLLFVDPETTARVIQSVTGMTVSSQKITRELEEIKSSFAGQVEIIDDSPENAPSMRIIQLVSNYDKVACGVLTVQEVGLSTLRSKCPWLDRWLHRLENL